MLMPAAFCRAASQVPDGRFKDLAGVDHECVHCAGGDGVGDFS